MRCMRNLKNLERLKNLKDEARKINDEIRTENEKLTEELNELIEIKCGEFIAELKQMSEYGQAGDTEIDLDFYCSYSYNKYPHLIHEVTSEGFVLKANPPGYSQRVIVYKENVGWEWYKKESKKFIAMNKDRILDAIEKKIADNMTRDIENSKVVDVNVKLKKVIEALKGNKLIYEIRKADMLNYEEYTIRKHENEDVWEKCSDGFISGSDSLVMVDTKLVREFDYNNTHFRVFAKPNNEDRFTRVEEFKNLGPQNVIYYRFSVNDFVNVPII